MVTREMVKAKIDDLPSDYLDHVYQVIRTIELKRLGKNQNEWESFIIDSYGCMRDAPLERGGQGAFEKRQAFL